MSTRYEIILSAVDKGLKAAFHGIKESTDNARKGMTAFNKTIGNGNKMANVLTGQLKALIGAYVGLGALKTLRDAATSAQSLDIGFKAILRSGQAAAAELDFIRSVSQELRLEFYSTADSYKGLLAAGAETSLDSSQIRGVFEGISEAGVALRLSNQDLQGSLRAVTQMLSKGKVSAEELRQQLGERLPSAVPLAAKALGVTTQELDKMLQRGEVTIEEFIPAFADALHDRYGPAAKEAAQDSGNLRAALNEFSTAWMDLKVIVAKSGFITEATNSLRSFSALFKDPEFQNSLKSTAELLFKLVGAFIQFTIENGKLLTSIAASGGLIWAFSKLTLVLQGINAAFAVMTGMGLIAWFGSLRAALIAIEAAFMAGRVSAVAFYAAATAGAIWGISKIIELGKAVWEAKKAHDELVQAEKNLYDLTGRIQEQYQDFADVSIPGDLTKLAQADLEQLQGDLLKSRAYWQNLVVELEHKSKKTTILGTATKEAREAQKELPQAQLRLDEIQRTLNNIGATDSLSRPTEDIKATITQLETFQKTAEAAYKAASDEAEKYGQKIRDLNQSIADREISLQDKIRDLRRQNMEDEQAAADLRLQAVEKEQAARQALASFQESGSARDLELAKKFATQAESAWTEYARSGEQATETAITGLERVNEILNQADRIQIDTFAKMKADAEDAMKKIEQMVEDINTKQQFSIPVELKNLTEVRDQINDLIKDETKHIKIKVSEQRAVGGRVGMASGGRFPGDSTRDSIPVLARPGEGFVRNEALKVWDRLFGRGFFEGINAPWSRSGRSIIDAMTGGLSFRLPAMHTPVFRTAYATGGRVAGPDAKDMGTVRLEVGNRSFPVTARQDVVKELKQAIARETAMRSNET
ncbi:MAG: tape measure protein [Thermodesulfobacteriota bacterium]|nr:tape measure protein [Thermodesulfobacteriota bacterium]